MLTNVRRFITAGALLVTTGIMLLLATLAPGFWFSFYPAVSRFLISALGRVSGIVSFSIWDISVIALVLFLIVWLVVSIVKKRILRWVSLFAELLALLVFLFVGIWGLNHFGPTAAEQLGLDVTTYSEDQLKEATVYYAGLASEYAEKVERDGDGAPVIPSFGDLSDKAVDGLHAMEQPLFDGGVPRVKKLTSSRLYSYMGFTGIFVDLTAESCINTDCYGISIPFTMCHELSHSCTVAKEDEANYCAFLICENHEDELFRYSGYYEAFVYCYNALYEVNKKAASKIWYDSSELLQQDCVGAGLHYAKFENETAQKVGDKVNDTYLKAFKEESGTKSYGEVTDCLIAHYLELREG